MKITATRVRFESAVTVPSTGVARITTNQVLLGPLEIEIDAGFLWYEAGGGMVMVPMERVLDILVQKEAAKPKAAKSA